jgi:hypothetical protein
MDIFINSLIIVASTILLAFIAVMLISCLPKQSIKGQPNTIRSRLVGVLSASIAAILLVLLWV